VILVKNTKTIFERKENLLWENMVEIQEDFYTERTRILDALNQPENKKY
jgi:hypothetical protein